jgi:hypothetical protein
LAEAEKSRVSNKFLPLQLEKCVLPLPHNIIHALKITLERPERQALRMDAGSPP